MLPKWQYIPPQLWPVAASFTTEPLPNKVKLRSVRRHRNLSVVISGLQAIEAVEVGAEVQVVWESICPDLWDHSNGSFCVEWRSFPCLPCLNLAEIPMCWNWIDGAVQEKYMSRLCFRNDELKSWTALQHRWQVEFAIALGSALALFLPLLLYAKKCQRVPGLREKHVYRLSSFILLLLCWTGQNLTSSKTFQAVAGFNYLLPFTH